MCDSMRCGQIGKPISLAAGVVEYSHKPVGLFIFLRGVDPCWT